MALITTVSKLGLLRAFSLKSTLVDLKKVIKDFNSRMNENVREQSSLGIYTSTYISKEGWPEVSRKPR